MYGATINEPKNYIPGENGEPKRCGFSKWKRQIKTAGKREVQASTGVWDPIESKEQQCHW